MTKIIQQQFSSDGVTPISVTATTTIPSVRDYSTEYDTYQLKDKFYNVPDTFAWDGLNTPDGIPLFVNIQSAGGQFTLLPYQAGATPLAKGSTYRVVITDYSYDLVNKKLVKPSVTITPDNTTSANAALAVAVPAYAGVAGTTAAQTIIVPFEVTGRVVVQ